MSLVGACPDYTFGLSQERKRYLEERRLYSIQICPNYRCAASCAYCLESCEDVPKDELPKEELLKTLEGAAAFGVKSLSWQGGDPLLYAPLWELVDRLSELGVGSNIFTNGLVSKKDAKNLTRLATGDPHYESTIVHIDTLDPEVYARIHNNPKTLEQRVAGYKRLLDAGYPPERVMGVMTLTRQACETIEETIDWFLDEMGVGTIGLCGFKPQGFGSDPNFEPALSDHRRAHEYRAKRLGEEWSEVGGLTMVGSLMCQTDIIIVAEGDVLGCLGIPLGSIYDQSIAEIFESKRDQATFRGMVKGQCGSCELNPMCVGCRGAAYAYLGDPWASDPKCWRNPEAKEYCLSTNS